MKKRFLTPTSVVVLIKSADGGRILMQKRKNTGFADGMWDFACSGHVEEGESMTEACARECAEELKIKASPRDFTFLIFVYKTDEDATYCYGYFGLDRYEGAPCIGEPEKCGGLAWFDINNLPENIIADRKTALEAAENGVHFLEYGWQK